MLAFNWEYMDYKLNKVQGILQTIMLEPYLSTNILVAMETKKKVLADILC